MNALDLVLALRLIRRQPVLTLTAVLALATGVGMATTGFTFLEAGLRAVLPFNGGDRFVMVDVYEEPEARRAHLTLDQFRTLRSDANAFDHLGALENAAQNLFLPGGEVTLVSGIAITPDSFRVLPYAPVLGRVLLPDDAIDSAPDVVVIRESLWRRHFSSDPGIIGRIANFSGVSREIVGVMPDTLEFPNSPEVWVPLHDTVRARVFGVIAPTAHLTVAQQQAQAVSNQFAPSPDGASLRLHVLPFIEAQSQGLATLAVAVVIVLVLVLVVIAANVANLVLARTRARSSELAVRSALGATRARLVAQVFTEILVLGTLASVIGVFASRQTMKWIEATLTDMPFWVTLDAGPGTAIFVACITVLTAAVGGAWPALRATRRDTLEALAQSNRRIAGGLGGASSAMVAMQVGLSIAALYAALVVARGVGGYMEGASIPGEELIVTARLHVPESRDDESLQPAAIVEAVRQLPGVQRAALSTSLPRLSPGLVMMSVRDATDATPSEPRPGPRVAITPDFVEALGGRVLVGRQFHAGDLLPNAPPVVIVNQPFAARFFGGANPVGRQLRFLTAESGNEAPRWHEIIGVVPDLGLSVGDDQFAAGVYVPLRDERSTYLTVVTSGDPHAVGRSLPSAITALYPSAQVREVLLLPEVATEDRAVFAGIGATLTTLGLMALALSAMGLYAMLSFAVSSRTREIAIRSALGATRADVLRTVLGRAAVPIVVGAALGPPLGVALVSARVIFAFRLPAEAGPWTVPLLSLLMIGTALMAAFTPARRAISIKTADALRAD